MTQASELSQPTETSNKLFLLHLIEGMHKQNNSRSSSVNPKHDVRTGPVKLKTDCTISELKSTKGFISKIVTARSRHIWTSCYITVTCQEKELLTCSLVCLGIGQTDTSTFSPTIVRFAGNPGFDPLWEVILQILHWMIYIIMVLFKNTKIFPFWALVMSTPECVIWYGPHTLSGITGKVTQRAGQSPSG